jgi:hypothetical protein
MIAERSFEGWFPKHNLASCGLGTTPRGIRFAIPLPSLLRRAIFSRYFKLATEWR